MNKNFIQIDSSDDEHVALQDIAAGTMLEFNAIKILLKELVPAKHKYFINNMQTGDKIFIYGVLVGRVETNILQGTLRKSKYETCSTALCLQGFFLSLSASGYFRICTWNI